MQAYYPTTCCVIGKSPGPTIFVFARHAGPMGHAAVASNVYNSVFGRHNVPMPVHQSPQGNTRPLLITVEEASSALRLGRTNVYGLIRSGRLRSVKIGHRRLVPLVALTEFIKSEMERSEV